MFCSGGRLADRCLQIERAVEQTRLPRRLQVVHRLHCLGDGREHCRPRLQRRGRGVCERLFLVALLQKFEFPRLHRTRGRPRFYRLVPRTARHQTPRIHHRTEILSPKRPRLRSPTQTRSRHHSDAEIHSRPPSQRQMRRPQMAVAHGSSCVQGLEIGGVGIKKRG